MKRLVRYAIISMAAAGCIGCSSTARHGGWFALQFMEKPSSHGASTQALLEEQTHFEQVLSYDAGKDQAAFESRLSQIREGDVIAYRKAFWDAYRDILQAKLNAVGYRVFKYGHLAIVVEDASYESGLRLFSSESFKGPNIREGLETLRTHDFDVYRLDKWEKVDRARLHEFVKASMAKAGKWYGYDFMGMFGIANSNLRPTSPDNIGYDYICSTVVVSALYYAGLELDAIQRDGLLDLVTPAQVVNSKGRLYAAGKDISIIETNGGSEDAHYSQALLQP
jgi:hypothetical protein